ncbi:hypothetical protein ALC57_16954, partial [Trachymyrmex cornetzi]
ISPRAVWRAFIERRADIERFVQSPPAPSSNPHKSNSINVRLLTVRFSTIENAKIVCLESSDVCLMMTESTILFMFNLDKCIEL